MTKSPSPSPSSAVLPSPHDDGTLLKYPRTYTTATLPEPQHRHPDARILEEEERRAAMATRTAAKSSGEGRGETIHDMPRGDAGRMSTMAADLRALAELTGLAGMAGLGGEQHTGASAGTVRGSTAANGDARASGDAHTSARANAGTAASRDTSPMTVPRAESFFGGPGAEAMQHYLFQQSPAERTVILAQLMQTLGIAAQRPPLPAVRAEYKHYYGTSTAPTPLDETEQRLLREAQHAMAGRPLLESQFAVADYLTQRETCRKRWGRVMDAALRRFLDDRQLKGGDVLEVRKGGSGGGKGYGGYPYDREFQSFGMSVRPRVVLERGKSYVDVGFTDLGMLLNATFASECDPKKTLVDGTSSSTAWPTPRHGKLPKQQQPPPPQQQRIHYIGYDASPVVIAKTMVLLEALRSGVDAKLIAELWFSLLWSPLTECVFRTAVDTVIESIVAAEAAVSGTSSGRMPPLDPNATLALATPRVREVLIAWQRATSPTVTEALHLLHGQLTFDMCYEGLMFVMADVRDRVDAARYFLRRSFPVRPMNSRAPTTEGPAHAQQLPQMPVSDHHSCGNVMTLSTPGRFGQCVLHEELIYFALPMSNILQMGRVNGDVANGTREPKRIFDEMFDYVVERIARISRLIQDGTLDITVHNRAVLPSATDVHAQIRQLQPAMIDWSNIVDYMHPRDFHRMARACSAQQAPSPPGSPDTPSPTTIHRAHSIGWVCRTYGASILDYPIETRYELYHAQFRPRLTELQRNIYQGRVLAAPCQSPMEIAEYCMGSVYAPRWTRHFMRLARVKGKGCDADGVNANGVDDVSGNDVSGNGDATTATIARSRSVVYADTDPLFMRSPSTFHFGFNYGDVPMER